VTIAKVDCTKEKNTCTEHGVRGYPTLIYFKDGAAEGEKYQGGRELDTMAKWVDEKL
jgi:thioredoxin-like negative regulator of GroEL